MASSIGAAWLSPAPYGVVVTEVSGDLLEQADADALIDPWNRNFLPRWALLVGGVSGQLKRRTGSGPWRDLNRLGLLPLGAAVATDSGDWADGPVLIHVAGLTAAWRATEQSVQTSTINALDMAWSRALQVVATPLIGAGHGAMRPARSLELIRGAAELYRPVRAACPTIELRIVTPR